jgi:hypothetical protein
MSARAHARRRPPARPHLIEVGIHIGAAWQNDDRAWFAADARRAHRLRAAYPDEWPAEAKCHHTAVRQVEPGQRLRLPFNLSDDLPPAEDAPEEAAWAVFDLVFEARAAGRQVVPEDEIWDRIELLSNGGRS